MPTFPLHWQYQTKSLLTCQDNRQMMIHVYGKHKQLNLLRSLFLSLSWSEPADPKKSVVLFTTNANITLQYGWKRKTTKAQFLSFAGSLSLWSEWFHSIQVQKPKWMGLTETKSAWWPTDKYARSFNFSPKSFTYMTSI